MDPCLLADTGVSQSTVALMAVAILVLAAVLLWFGRKGTVYRLIPLMAMVFGLAIFMPSAVYAQSADDCVDDVSQVEAPAAPGDSVDPADPPVVANVVAQDDDPGIFALCGSGDNYINILANDSTTEGTLDPATIDLDVITPGIQQTITVGDFTVTVESSGVLTVAGGSGASSVEQIQYTVQNTEGLTSNIATVVFGCPPA